MRERILLGSIVLIVTVGVVAGGGRLGKDHKPRIAAIDRPQMNRLMAPDESQAKGAAKQLTSDEQEVLRVNKRMLEAIQRKDADTLGRILADDFVVTDWSGEVLSKTQFIKRITGSDGEEVPVRVEDVNLRTYGYVALLTCRLRLTDSLIIGDFTGHWRETDVFVKREGRWILVSSQQTPIVRR
jgi:ketosteroid isomerase-like protein